MCGKIGAIAYDVHDKKTHDKIASAGIVVITCLSQQLKEITKGKTEERFYFCNTSALLRHYNVVTDHMVVSINNPLLTHNNADRIFCWVQLNALLFFLQLGIPVFLRQSNATLRLLQTPSCPSSFINIQSTIYRLPKVTTSNS